VIDFSLEEEQRLLVQTVRDFAGTWIRPRLREFERAGDVPADVRNAFASLGLALLDVPERWGGLGQSQVTAALVHEELAFGDAGAAVALFRSQPLVAAVLELGDDVQRERLLREPVVGAVALAGEARARRLPGSYRLEGTKRWVVGSGCAIVLADADADETGPAAFVVGPVPGTRYETLGLDAARIGELVLDGCEVSEADRLPAGGDLGAALRRFQARYALINAARQVGLGRAAYEYSLGYAEERRAFGKPIAHFQSIAFLLAEVHMEVESARGLLWRAAAAWDMGLAHAPVLVAEAAVHAAEAAWRAADAAVQILGGAGYVRDHPVEKWMRDTQTLALLGSSAEQHLMTVAAALLGDETLAAAAPSVQPVLT
jgi:alkylation response protein AidB-like acyl-CoA dehydrogenase